MKDMVLNYQIKGKELMYKMPKELDHHVAQNLCRELDLLIESYQIMELGLDFVETEFMDSSGIGVVIGRSKTMKFRDGKIYAKNLNERINMIFTSVGLNKIIEMREA